MVAALHPNAWFACPNCRSPLSIEAARFGPYFAKAATVCGACNQAIDLWEGVRGWINFKFAFGATLGLAGARSTLIEVPLRPNETTLVDLTTAGVPENAEIVHLNLTGRGSFFPIVVHGNAVIRDPFPPKFHVFGRPLPDDLGEGELGVHAVWFVRRSDDTIVRHLVDAARHYESNRFDGVVVPANIAAEAAVTPAIAKALRGYAGSKAIKDFLQNGATYSHQLNVLLPLVADLLGCGALPTEIRGTLNRLRSLRNDVGHRGRCDPVSQAEGAGFLAAAIFAVRYAAVVEEAAEKKWPAAQATDNEVTE